jgi:membrane protease YdiL (CAAX protease family)
MRDWIKHHQLSTFFAVSYAIMYGTLFGYMALQPGQPMLAWSAVWLLSVFSPTLSALIVSWLTGGVAAVKELLAGFGRWRVGWKWYLAAGFLLLGPMAIALTYLALGNPSDGLAAGMTAPLLLARILTQLVAGPASEEAGWRGFALPRLQARFSALTASLILGVVWTFWHLPLFFLTGETQVGIPFPFYLALVVTLSVYLTWLYNNTGGSLVITTLAHWSFNLTGVLITGPVSLMPVTLFYMTASPLLLAITIAACVRFGPKHLTRHTHTRPEPAVRR